MAKNAIPGMKTGGGAMSKATGAAVVLTILVIVIKSEDGLCRENETDDRDRVRL